MDRHRLTFKEAFESARQHGCTIAQMRDNLADQERVERKRLSRHFDLRRRAAWHRPAAHEALEELRAVIDWRTRLEEMERADGNQHALAT